MQSAGAPFITVYGVKPDFMLILTGFAGTVAGRTNGMVIGFFCGLFVDLLNMDLFGFNIFLLSFAGLLTGTMQNRVFKNNYLFPLALILGLSVLKEAAWGLAVVLSGYRLTDPAMFASQAVMRALYNGIIAMPVFSLFYKIRRLIVSE